MKILLAYQSVLILAVVFVLLCLWLPVCSFDRDRGVEVLVISGLLCLAPGLVVLAIPLVVGDRLIGVAVLLGGSLRLLVVLIGLVVVSGLRPDIPPVLFGGCLVFVYLVCLAFETLVAVRCLAARSKSAGSSVSA